MFNTHKTIYGARIETSKITNSNVGLLPNTTLNEKFNVANSSNDVDTTKMTLSYAVVGIGIRDSDTGQLAIPQYSGKYGSLFKHAPFAIRLVTSDFTPTEANSLGLRLRSLQVIDGVQYVCYYGMTTSQITTDHRIKRIDMVNGTGKLSVFDTNNPVILNPSESNTDSEYYVATTTDLNFNLTKAQVDTILDAASLLYSKSKDLLVIREIGLCYGIDRLTSNGAYDVDGCQLGYIIELGFDSNLQQTDINGGISTSLSIGGANLL